MGKEERGERREEREYQHKGLWYCQNNLFTCQLIYPSTYLLVKLSTCQIVYLSTHLPVYLFTCQIVYLSNRLLVNSST